MALRQRRAEDREREDMSRRKGVFDETYTETILSIKKISIVASLILFLAECSIAIVYIAMEKITTWLELIHHVNRFIVIQFLIILFFDGCFAAVKQIMLKGGRFDEARVRRACSLGHLCVLACAMTYVHYRFPTVYAAPIIVMFMSIIYVDKLITAIVGIYCTIGTTIGVAINELTVNDMPHEWYIGFTFAIALYLIAGWIATKLIDVERSKETEQSKANDKLTEFITNADLDGLTRIWNYSKIEKMLRNGAFVKHGLKLAMLDIDNFKLVNDTYGHDFGNVVLRRLAGILREHQDSNIFVARYGGEEFCIFANAEVNSNKFRWILDDIRIEFGNQEYRELCIGNRITVSLGWTEIPQGAKLNKNTGFEFLKLADKALYVAKRSTKNRVVGYCEKDVYAAIEMFETYYSFKKDRSQFSEQRCYEIERQFRYLEVLGLKMDTLEEYRNTMNEVYEEICRTQGDVKNVVSEVSEDK